MKGPTVFHLMKPISLKLSCFFSIKVSGTLLHKSYIFVKFNKYFKLFKMYSFLVISKTNFADVLFRKILMEIFFWRSLQYSFFFYVFIYLDFAKVEQRGSDQHLRHASRPHLLLQFDIVRVFVLFAVDILVVVAVIVGDLFHVMERRRWPHPAIQLGRGRASRRRHGLLDRHHRLCLRHHQFHRIASRGDGGQCPLLMSLPLVVVAIAVLLLLLLLLLLLILLLFLKIIGPCRFCWKMLVAMPLAPFWTKPCIRKELLRPWNDIALECSPVTNAMI